MRVHPRAVLPEDRLGHERREKPVPVGDVADDETERREVVRRLERLGIAEVDLVLARRHLVVPRLDFEAHGDEILDDQPPDLLRPIHRRLVEVAALVVGVRGGIAAGIELKDEELRLHPGHHGIAQSVRPGDLPLQGLARAPCERRAIRIVDVADESCDAPALVVVGQDTKRVEVGLEHHVRLLDSHESLDRRAVEHDVALERLLELALGHLDVLVDAENVGELEAQEGDPLLLAHLEDLALRAAGGLESGSHG